MKINIIATLLFALKASTATGEKPVQTTESCEKRGIETWDDCRDTCVSLAKGRRLSARVNEGGTGDIFACYCTYGPNLENSYTCTRPPAPLPPFPTERGLKCSDSDIKNQEECFQFCTEHKRSATYVGSARGPVSCACQNVQGGPAVWQCKGEGSASYLRSS
jgi:hypothetical protein